MTTLELKSKKREVFGKKVKALRRMGQIPAVVYGGKGSSLPISINSDEFNKVFKAAGETTIIKIFIAAPEGGEPRQGRDGAGFKNVLIYDTARDAINGSIRHVDFYEVKMDEKIIKKVPIVFVSSAPAVVDLGGVLIKSMQELEIRALPADLPHDISVDISVLKTFDDNILVGDIKLPNNVETLENADTSVAVVAAPRSDAEIEALSSEVEEKVEEVKVETEETAKEREKEKTAEPIV
ncbi:MAG: 50S ribosomal protein L25 [Parcubacteria group bacterium]|nr:50S ribosomal protein L25 [Parcubacteria group bacterium]